MLSSSYTVKSKLWKWHAKRNDVFNVFISNSNWLFIFCGLSLLITYIFYCCWM